jgi:uncharacterized protein (TIGR02452 family)
MFCACSLKALVVSDVMAEGEAFSNIFIFRTDVWKETQAMADKYPFLPSEKIMFERGFTVERKYDGTDVTVEDIDSIEAGRELINMGLNPLVLNFADDKFAGGAVEVGSGAQEESLFRRTNLCLTLLQDFYPIRQNEAVYTPMATVFRDVEGNKNRVLEEAYPLAFVAVPGIHNPRLTAEGRLGDVDEEVLRHKVRLIFQVGAKGGHDSLVLGALGCGAWRNPPEHVAEIFKEVLIKYRGMFKKIVFACLNFGEGGYVRGGAGAGRVSNFDVFTRVLIET